MCILLDCQCRYVVMMSNVLNPMLLCSVVLRQQHMTFGCLNNSSALCSSYSEIICFIFYQS